MVWDGMLPEEQEMVWDGMLPEEQEIEKNRSYVRKMTG